MQQNLQKSCFRCKRKAWHIQSNIIFQSPKYVIVIANRYIYIDKHITHNMGIIPTDMNTINHYGLSVYFTHYTTSARCCGKSFNCNVDKIAQYGIISIRGFSMEYKMIYNEFWTSAWDLAHSVHPMRNMSRNKHRSLSVGLCVLSWWPQFLSGGSFHVDIHISYHGCALSHYDKECGTGFLVLSQLITYLTNLCGTWHLVLLIILCTVYYIKLSILLHHVIY